MRKPRRFHPNAFTLIEVLVVLAIILLLVAILIPSLAAAREKSRRVVCQTRLRNLGTAMATYAHPKDELIPGDSMMGHDIWGSPNDGPLAGSGTMAVNLGHLLIARSLPAPDSEDHPFYCPTLSKSGAPWSFTYRNSGPHAASQPRGFEGWGQPGRVVNIGYEYRDTIDNLVTTPTGTTPTPRYYHEVNRLALVADVFSWGTGKYAHEDRYHFVRGDASVGVYKDPGSPEPLHVRYESDTNDALIFAAFDAPACHDRIWPSQ